MFALHVRPGLEIRLLEKRHAPEVFARVDAERDHIRPFLPWADLTRGVADVEAFITRSLRRFGEQNGWDAGIWLDGAYAGGIGAHYYDWLNRKTEIGYWLSREAVGRGIMTDCVRQVCRYLFDELGLHRIEIRCATENVRSRAIPERLGFTFEGVLRGANLLHGRYHDQALYSLLATDGGGSAQDV